MLLRVRFNRFLVIPEELGISFLPRDVEYSRDIESEDMNSQEYVSGKLKGLLFFIFICILYTDFS